MGDRREELLVMETCRLAEPLIHHGMPDPPAAQLVRPDEERGATSMPQVRLVVGWE